MFTITVQLTQKAILKRNPSAEASVTTWEGRSSMGLARDSQDIRIRVGNRVDEFINDYLSENPGGPAD
jgi:hypothetical protein